MRIAHWNTHHGGVDSTGHLNVQGITDWLIKFNADYISLNEIEQNDGYGNLDQLEYHRSALEVSSGQKWYSAFCQMNGGSKNQGIGIAFLSRFPLDSVIRKGLNGGRPAMSIVTPFGLLFTLHADPDSNKARNIQLNQVLCAIGQSPKMICCGDFNASVGDIELASWNTWYKDAGLALHKPTHGTHRIDYIWYRGFNLVSCETPDTSVNGVFPSDHNPIIAEF